MSIESSLAIQSYCFRGFNSNKEVAEKVKEIGLSAVEPYQGHIDFSDEAACESALSVYSSAGIKIVSCGVNTISGDGKDIECFFRFAQEAGCSVISADIVPPAAWEVFAVTEKLAEKYNVDVALHNHGGSHWLGNAQMLDTVFKRTNSRIGLMLDTAWAIDAREDPVELVERFSGRIKGVHFKDFLYSPQREPEDVVIGTGILNLPLLVKTLKEQDFSGVTILEYEGDVQNPVPTLKKCVEAMKPVWKL